MKIADCSIGSRFNGRLVLSGAEIRKTKTVPPKAYLSLTLTDGYTSVLSNIWGYTKATLPERGVYDIVADIGEYNGKKQLNNVAYKLSADQSLSEFSITCNADIDALDKSLKDLLGSVKNSALYVICSELLDTYHHEMLVASSAVGVHHVGIGGNAQHTIEVALIARQIATIMQLAGYSVNVDLCTAGALIHDIGKLRTYTVNGPIVEMTLEGSMQDHIAIGAYMLLNCKTAKCYPATAALLEHIILSHHGCKEYGSPVTPKFMEAYIVSAADGISASINTLQGYNAKAEVEKRPGDMTERIFTLNNYEHIKQTVVEKMLGK